MRTSAQIVVVGIVLAALIIFSVQALAPASITIPDPAGRISFGSPPDVHLYRAQSNVWATNSSFVAVGGISANNLRWLAGTGIQTVSVFIGASRTFTTLSDAWASIRQQTAISRILFRFDPGTYVMTPFVFTDHGTSSQIGLTGDPQNPTAVIFKLAAGNPGPLLTFRGGGGTGIVIQYVTLQPTTQYTGTAIAIDRGASVTISGKVVVTNFRTAITLSGRSFLQSQATLNMTGCTTGVSLTGNSNAFISYASITGRMPVTLPGSVAVSANGFSNVYATNAVFNNYAVGINCTGLVVATYSAAVWNNVPAATQVVGCIVN